MFGGSDWHSLRMVVSGAPASVEVRALLRVEKQRPRDRVEHLHGRVDVAALLEPRVPGDADPGELCHLFAAETGRAAPPRRTQAHLLGRDPLPAAAQERGQLAPAELVRSRRRAQLDGGHSLSIPNRRRAKRVALIPG